jgi:MoaA/NifB/PqqE/SkfB family radical SAM enzyme
MVLTGSAAAFELSCPCRSMKKDAQLNVYNFAAMRAQPPQEFEFLRLDSNNDCNVHCVYCHNHRSKDSIPTEDLSAFLDQNVMSVEHVQVGCIMEPTLDPRLADVVSMIAASRTRAKQMFILQTNGILLHRHDNQKMRDAGLTDLSVSIDAADPAIHKALRGGTSMAKVHSNITAFRTSCPSVKVTFITTVTKLNIDGMSDLVLFGLSLGVEKFILREVFYHPTNDIVDHSRMPSLVLDEDEFARMKGQVLRDFEGKAEFLFADVPTLERYTAQMRVDSQR